MSELDKLIKRIEKDFPNFSPTHEEMAKWVILERKRVVEPLIIWLAKLKKSGNFSKGLGNAIQKTINRAGVK